MLAGIWWTSQTLTLIIPVLDTPHLCVGRVPHKCLSDAFTAIDLDLQQRVDSMSGFPEAQYPAVLWESDGTLKVPVTCSGRWNAVVFWFKVSPLHATTGLTLEG